MSFKISNLIRLSKAKTAYGLLRDVQKAVREEPRRANMGTFTDKVDPEAYNAPACGTVGCVAGWISILGGQGMVDDDAPARRLLGDEVKYHFTRGSLEFNEGGYHYVFNGGSGDACAQTAPGTPEHAAAVVDRIERFIQGNLKALKARRLPSLRTRRRWAAEGR
jgi:hypothetical protein